MWRQPKLQYGTRSTLQVYATYYATHIIFRMSLHKERNLNLLLFVALTLSSSARWKKTKKMTLELTVPPTIKVNRVVKNTNSCIRLYLLENTAVADPGKGLVSPLTFGPNWGPKARKCFLSRPPPLISGSGWPPPPIGLDPHCTVPKEGAMGQIGKCLVLPLGYVNFTIVIFRPI